DEEEVGDVKEDIYQREVRRPLLGEDEGLALDEQVSAEGECRADKKERQQVKLAGRGERDEAGKDQQVEPDLEVALDRGARVDAQGIRFARLRPRDGSSGH